MVFPTVGLYTFCGAGLICYYYSEMDIRRKFTPITVSAAVVAVLVFGFVFMLMYGKAKPTGPMVSVLFLGNSFTAVNDLPSMVHDIARSLDGTVVFSTYAPGGYTLAQHVKDSSALNLIGSKPWNFVVLQEQSELPALQDSLVSTEVLPYAQELNDTVHQSSSSAKTIFFETWGYKNGDQKYCGGVPTLCSYTTMQAQLHRSYSAMAHQNSGLLAPVGEAWALTRQLHPDIELYGPDGMHPSQEGTYLSACVFYMVLFNKDVIGAAPLGIDQPRAHILQLMARQAIKGY